MKAKLVSLALLSAVVVGAGVGVTQLPHSSAASNQPVAVQTPVQTQTLPDFAAIAEANKGAVVNITVTERARQSAAPQTPEEPKGPPFGEFFRRYGPQGPRMPRRGMGSGFIVQPDGVILTNAHVVDGAAEVTVRLTDRREFKGKVLGADKATDIAVVKIEAKGLPAVRLGDPSKVRVGEWVVAI